MEQTPLDCPYTDSIQSAGQKSPRCRSKSYKTGQRLTMKTINLFRRQPVPPIGYWRCTSVEITDKPNISGFNTCEIYTCQADDEGNARLYPQDGGEWALYWNASAQRFDCSKRKITFEYVGPQLGKDDPESSSRLPVMRKVA